MYRISVLMLCFLLAGPRLVAQLIPGSAAEGLRAAKDAVEMREEWWLGGTIAGGLHSAFGTLDVITITSPAPEIPPAHARTTGGWGASVMIAPALEYRPYRSSLGMLIATGVEFSRMQSTSTEPVSDVPYAYNATFETNVTSLSWFGSAMATWYIGTSGVMVMGGPTIDVPMSITAVVWQHENLADSMAPGDEPGFPQTSIQYNPGIARNVRVGLQVGCAMNIMAGLFGYTSQLVTPYIIGHVATPLVTTPSPWNAVAVRLGVMWRAGL